MADGIEFKLEGLETVQAKLKSLAKETAGQSETQATNFALLRAAQYVRDQAKQGASRLDDPETARSIADNIIAKKRSKRTNIRSQSLGYRVGVMGGGRTWKPGEEVDKSSGARTPHFHLLELGTENMQARPFMRPALTKNIQTVTGIFVRNYEKKIDNILKKQSR